MLLDTCVVIDLSRGNAGARAFVEGVDSLPAVSVLTATEVLQCARTRAETRLFERLFQAWSVLSLDLEISQSATRLLAEYEKDRNLDIVDTTVAATAMAHGLTLATMNIERFPMFPELTRPY